MDFIRTFKSFINSYYLNESFRMTAGILVPAFLMFYFDLLQTGIVISLGALFVSITDNPGPIHHRTNGMMVCNIILFFVSIISGFVNTSPILLGTVLVISCFIFSMLGAYGARAGAIGISALVLLVLDIGQTRSGWDVFEYALLISSGGLWYMSFSLLLYNFKPYKLIQQALGEWLQSIGEFLLLRSEFYKKEVDYASTSNKLLHQQALVQEKQNVVNDLIFKTRNVVKETTNTGKVLVMMYIDTAEMFEKIMTSYQSYSTLHHYFDETGILEDYRKLLVLISTEVQEVGIAIKSGSPSRNNSALSEKVTETYTKYKQLRESYLKPENIEGFITLKRIMDNIKGIAERLQELHKYTTYDSSLRKRRRHDIDYNAFIQHEPVNPRVLLDNLTFKSDIFRHSIRLTVAVITGYIVSLIFTFGYSYWILLTIVVILKPAYSLSKKRNTDRLFGTISGVLIGLVLLLTINNSIVLLVLMIIFMIGYFSTMRTNYFISVLLMTPYVVLFFHLLYPGDFPALLKDRVIDTAIGSVIAFATIFFVLPSWERQKISALMTRIIEEDLKYFTLIGNALIKKDVVTTNALHVARKDALVALANLSDAFNRMLSEPKNQQEGIEDIHNFVVLNHMFNSYVATLSEYIKIDSELASSEEMQKVIEGIKNYLATAELTLKGDTIHHDFSYQEIALQQISDHANELLNIRKSELEEGKMETPTIHVLFDVKSIIDQVKRIYKVSKDIHKVSGNLKLHTS